MAQLGKLWPGAVGVSGGGDSLALMLLLAQWAKTQGHEPPKILSVDHRLSPQSKVWAERVKAEATRFGLECHVLVWTGTKPKSDIEAKAREARYRLMGDWCRSHGIFCLYLAHTEEDQAETFLLRLARGSGLDGLSAMSPVGRYPAEGFPELSLVRPLLGFTRAELRQFLKARRVAWHEDPMNADPRFARVRFRALLPQLEKAGLTPSRIAQAARHLARARDTLEGETTLLIERATRAGDGHLLLDAAALRTAPREVGLRALAELLRQTGSKAYRPRFERLESLFDSLFSPRFKGRTLHGCHLSPAPVRHRAFGSATLLLEKEPGRLKPS